MVWEETHLSTTHLILCKHFSFCYLKGILKCTDFSHAIIRCLFCFLFLIHELCEITANGSKITLKRHWIQEEKIITHTKFRYVIFIDIFCVCPPWGFNLVKFCLANNLNNLFLCVNWCCNLANSRNKVKICIPVSLVCRLKCRRGE